jgi:cellulose synthase/poly-beta-1,6-N-acetylglucosamine synthase-like glycosyltransferase
MISLIIFLGFFTEMFNDFNLIVKIFALLTIASFVRNRLGTSPIGLIAIGALTFFILFDFWKFFGPIYILYILLTFGISGMIVDFFFISAGQGPEEQKGPNSPISAGTDLLAKRTVHHAAHAAARMRRPGR